VTVDDAAALAGALERALGSKEWPVYEIPNSGPFLLRDGMLPEELFEANRGLSAPFLRGFIAFLRRGGLEGNQPRERPLVPRESTPHCSL
jgi:hypothetical protein